VRLKFLLLSFCSVFLFSLPVKAGQLVFWRFDPSSNRLVFTTNGGVQPKAILIANPTRLIIDLPGTTFQRRTVTQPLAGALHTLRVGQLDARTARLVVELDPGYTLDPRQIVFRGTTPEQWSVQIPQPQRMDSAQLSNCLARQNCL